MKGASPLFLPPFPSSEHCTPQISISLIRRQGLQTLNKLVRISQARVLWLDGSVLPLFKGAAGARGGGEGAAAGPFRFTAGMWVTPSQRRGKRWDTEASGWRTFSRSHPPAQTRFPGADSTCGVLPGDLGVTARVFAN